MSVNIRESIYNNAILTSLIKDQKKYNLSIIGNMLVFDNIDIQKYSKDNLKIIEAINKKMVEKECENLLKEGRQWYTLVSSFNDVIGDIINKNIDIYKKYKDGLVDSENGYHSACVLLGTEELIFELNKYASESETDNHFIKINHILDINLPKLPKDPYKEIIGNDEF